MNRRDDDVARDDEPVEQRVVDIWQPVTNPGVDPDFPFGTDGHASRFTRQRNNRQDREQ